MLPNEYNKMIEDSKNGIVIPCILNGKNIGYKKLDTLPYGMSTLGSSISGLTNRLNEQKKINEEQNKQIIALQEEIQSLTKYINEYKELNAKTEDLLLKTVESLNVRVSNLEVQMDEALNKIKYL